MAEIQLNERQIEDPSLVHDAGNAALEHADLETPPKGGGSTDCSVTKTKNRRAGGPTQLAFDGQDRPAAMAPPRAVFAIAPAAKVTEAYDAWWTYAFERQEVYFRRLRDEPAPWTHDEVLRRHRFTNVYRAADRVSQYLIRHVIYRDGLPTEYDEVVFRVLLFKLFNRIETWETLSRSIGALALSDDPFARIDEILAGELRAGNRIYSAAYIMPTMRGGSSHSKHSGHLALLKQMMVDHLPARLVEARTMEAGFHLLRSYPGIGRLPRVSAYHGHQLQ